ncbi:LacI family transcriptional regulator [Spirochaetia bacterium]|nr:LacI family transcriptional regulator [Spirochaetia bacterium]
MNTIRDVAKEANVSVATVSRVINNRGYLSAEIKQRVADAMQALDYHPNELARSLLSQKSHIIGLIVPSARNPFYGEIIYHVEGYAYEQGYKVLICNSLQDRDKEREYIEMLKRSQVDGIIMGSHVADTADYTGLNLPVISLDRQLGPGIPYVCCDNYQGGVLAVRHLIAKGCRNLLHFCDGLGIQMIANKRTEAFFDVCRTTNIPYTYVELPDSTVVNFREQELIRSTLETHPEVDGIFASNDVTATAVIGIAAGMGRKIGRDLKVIGFDGSFLPALMRPRLSTIRQSVDALGRYAVEYLIRMMSNEPVPTQTVLPVVLQEEESTLG